ncbi:hypothetical protein [Actinopolyspora erythraea]|uniref:hypothetical protein n=1 Tax=Actinopolyspora erythraea TaxID=414996 RepID=UPI0006939074|nr:hypothetical protein [Actinopolyspora erythraea]
MTVPAQPIRHPAVEVSPPAVQPPEYGLLSVARFLPSPQRRWEGSGIVFPNDGCAPGGGIWLNPCEHPPPPEEIEAFTVTVEQPAASEFTLHVSLSARHETYDGAPVAVVVGTQRVVLDAIGQGHEVTVDAAGTYPVTADIAATGSGPDCRATGEVTVVGSGGTPEPPVTLRCTVTPGWPVKRIPMGVEFTEGRAFTVYEAAGCLPAGFEDAANRAHRRFQRHEPYWVERHFARTALQGSHVEVLHPGTAVPLVRAIGELEQALAARYGGLGVLHLPREVYGFVPDRLLTTTGGRLRTPLNNDWSLGGGYSNTGPGGQPAGANQAWLYATGPVMGLRSEVQIRESFNHARNERFALAERAYVLTADCLHLAVLADLPGAG